MSAATVQTLKHEKNLSLERLTPPKANTAKKSVTEYPFCKMTIGSSTPNFELGSRVPLIEAMPIADTMRSNEWITRGKRIKPDGSASISINSVSVAQ